MNSVFGSAVKLEDLLIVVGLVHAPLVTWTEQRLCQEETAVILLNKYFAIKG